MDTTVHAHPARGAGQVRSIAGEQHAAGTVVVNQAAMNAVRADFNNLIGLLTRHDTLQLALDRPGFQRLLDRLIRIRVKRTAPDVRQTQQGKCPLIAPHIIDIRKAGQLIFEPVRGGRQNRGLGVGFTGEGHAGEFSTDRAGTVCGDQVTGADGFIARGRADGG